MPSEITRLLDQLQTGNPESANQLLPLVYGELRKLAAAKLAGEKAGHSLVATGLVHEAYLRLVGNQSFESRRHFFAAAAESMRRILIDRARARSSKKRGGGVQRLDLEIEGLPKSEPNDRMLVSLDVALTKLERIEPQKAELVKMRYFAGLTIRESAEILGISTATADRHWAYAKAWLQTELNS